MKLTVSELSKLMGVSVRTLHYYDEIGLLKPASVSNSGYRCYDDNSVEVMRQILFYRELGFSLTDIATFFANPDYDKTDALKKHREVLLIKRKQLDDLISVIDGNLHGDSVAVGTIIKESEDLFKMKNKYAEEVKKRWGDTSEYAVSQERESCRSDADEAKIQSEADEIFAKFGKMRNDDPASAEAAALVEEWRDYISKNHYPCSNEMLACLGEMYTADERFTTNLDRFGEGTAKFMSDAIRHYCNRSQQ